MTRQLPERREVRRIIRAFHHHKQFRIRSKHGIAPTLRGCVPVQMGVFSAPLRSTSQFVAEVSAYHPFLMLIPAHDSLPIREPFLLGIFRVVPKGIAVVVLAAPIRAAHMIIENNHEVSAGQSGNDRRPLFPWHVFREIADSPLRRNRERAGSCSKRFICPWKSHRIDADLLDLRDDRGKRRVVQTANYKFLLVETVPVDGSESHDVPSRVQNVMAAGVKRWTNLLLRRNCRRRSQKHHD